MITTNIRFVECSCSVDSRSVSSADKDLVELNIVVAAVTLCQFANSSSLIPHSFVSPTPNVPTLPFHRSFASAPNFSLKYQKVFPGC